MAPLGAEWWKKGKRWGGEEPLHPPPPYPARGPAQGDFCCSSCCSSLGAASCGTDFLVPLCECHPSCAPCIGVCLSLGCACHPGHCRYSCPIPAPTNVLWEEEKLAELRLWLLWRVLQYLSSWMDAIESERRGRKSTKQVLEKSLSNNTCCGNCFQWDANSFSFHFCNGSELLH